MRFSLGELDVADKVGIGCFLSLGMVYLETKKIVLVPSLSRNTPFPKKKITYANFVCDIKLFKNESHRVHLTVGGDKLTYGGNPISLAISLLDL